MNVPFYIKVIGVNVLKTYSCDECGKWFKSKEEFTKNPPNNFFTICSKKCEFRFIYNLIKKQYYSEQNLMLMLIIIEKQQKNKWFNREEAIYELSKYYNKVGLSNITYIGSRLKAKAQGSKSEDRLKAHQLPPLCNRGDEPELEPNFSKAHNLNLSLSNFGEQKNEI